MPGTVLEDAYHLEKQVGEGGMGMVFEATHLRLGGRVAIKLMSNTYSQDTEKLARFRREAEITSGLGHPHIVQVTDFGNARNGDLFLAMELLRGEDLEQRLRRTGRLPMGQTLRVIKQVASALTAAHEKGIVHRDLKPANIFLVEIPGEEDFVKVLDFGISKVSSAGMKLTGSRHILGTPNYMSPEQALGRSGGVDHRSDQYALACIAWQMLSGVCPFQGDDLNQLLSRVAHRPPPPLDCPDGSPEVEKVLLRALSKDPADRFETIRAFAKALKHAAFARTLHPKPGPGDAAPIPPIPDARRAPATPSAALDIGLAPTIAARVAPPIPPTGTTTPYVRPPTKRSLRTVRPPRHNARLLLGLGMALLLGALIAWVLARP